MVGRGQSEHSDQELSAPPSGALPDHWSYSGAMRLRLDPERSAVLIDATSSVHPIRTRTEGLEGSIEFDVHTDGRINVGAGMTGELSLPVERLRSGNPLEDRELRRRIAARRFPTIEGR